MFEIAELGQTVSKEEFHAQVPELRSRLLDLQQRLKKADFATVVVFGGVEGAGKGETLQVLHEWMDPRYLATHTYADPSDEERERPYFWRFFRALPPRGRIGVFFGSWYARPLLRRFDGKGDDLALDAALRHINTFEEMLVEDGVLLLKFWFHLSKEAQKKRVKALLRDPRSRWRVRPIDKLFVKRYDDYRLIAERAIRLTSTGEAPWLIVDGADERHRYLTVGQHLASALARRLDAPGPAEVPAVPVSPAANGPPRVSILDQLDLGQKLEKDEYEEQLEEFQGKLHALGRKARRKGVSSILVFEGWDAAGKGGIIRRVAGAMDPRDYGIFPIAAPTDEERAHHYLWRFWRHLPRAGRVTIFDRSWYGRVLVERVEGLACEAEWGRAYPEINDFEQQLCEHGIVLMKFWVHISKDEQLQRFREREQTPFKRFKIGPEDYRNRDKWDAYDRAVNDMVERCSTEFAPWTLVEGNDKRFARVKVLRLFCQKLEESL